MDAHYHKVMKAREDQPTTGSRYYFAYSSALDRDAFLEWRDEHSYQFFDLPVGKVGFAENEGLVFNFVSRWWGGRVAGLESKSDSQVWGVLYEISNKDWPVVQHKEGFVTGMAIEKTVKVQIDGKTIEATAFTTNPSRARTDADISKPYIEALVRGATASGLPEDYISQLKSYV